MTSLLEDTKQLVDRIKKQFPETSVTTNFFPSGAMSMDIRSEKGTWTINYISSFGFGLDELTGAPDEAFNMNYKYCYTDLGATAKKLFELLNDRFS